MKITDKQRIDFVQRNELVLVKLAMDSEWRVQTHEQWVAFSTGKTWRKAVDKAMKEFKK